MANKKKLSIPQLAKLLENNPGCVVTLDNDCWWIDKAPTDDVDEDDDDHEPVRLVDSDDIQGGSSCYGQDILFALAYNAGIEIDFC